MEYDLASRRWFHPLITGVEAEKLLKAVGEDGSFLCRRSQDSTNYTISILRDDEVVHLRMQTVGGYYSLFGDEQFISPYEVVEYCLENPGVLKEKSGGVIELKQPVLNHDTINNRWYHGNLSARDAETLLFDKGQHGSYLVRSSYHTPGDYVLSVRLKERVTHVRIHGKGKKFDVGGGRLFDSIEDLIEYYKKCLLMDDRGTAIYLYQPCHCTTFMASSINERVSELKRVSWSFTKSGFCEEFDRLQQMEYVHLHTYSRMEGARYENMSKNRFRNVIPYDYTRVILEREYDSAVGSDYINASYIKGEAPSDTSSRDYIATQGCLQDTVIDFWRMVYQVKCRIIVMVTNEVEHGRIKCARYWPNSGEVQEYGHLIVQCVTEDHSRPHYILREFFVKSSKDPRQKPRRIHHYHFTGWPDHSVPEDPSSVLSFLQDIHSQKKDTSSTSPMVVHCCNGLGRTGALVVIDIILNVLRLRGLHHEIDIWKSVQSVRTQRPGIIQTETQYKFVYMTIMEYVNKRTSASRPVSSVCVSEASGGSHDGVVCHNEVLPLIAVNGQLGDPSVTNLSWGRPQKTMLYLMTCPVHGGKGHWPSNKKKCTCETSVYLAKGNTVRVYKDGDIVKMDLTGSINDPHCLFNYYTSFVMEPGSEVTYEVYALESTGPRCEGYYLQWNISTSPYSASFEKGISGEPSSSPEICWKRTFIGSTKDKSDHKMGTVLQTWSPDHSSPPLYLAFTSDGGQPYLTENPDKATRLGTIMYNDVS